MTTFVDSLKVRRMPGSLAYAIRRADIETYRGICPQVRRFDRAGDRGRAVEEARRRGCGDSVPAQPLPKAQAEAIKVSHFADEDRPIETLWDVAVGATAYARGIKYQDERVAIEREAGKIMAMASR